MASSSSILLWPSGRLSPSGTFNVQKCVHGCGAQRLSIVCHSRGKGGAELERAKLNIVTRRMRLLLESEGLLANEAAFSLVNSMSTEGRTVLISALFPATRQAVDFFEQADANSDGMVDAAEFACFVEAQAYFFEDSNRPLTTDQLYHLGTRAAIGMVVSGKFMPEVKITARQLESREAWWAETVGASAGVTLGCLLGLAQLLFLHQKAATAATATSVIASAEKGVSGISSQSSGVGSNGGTAFATISTIGAPGKHHCHGPAHTVGGSVFILMVTTAMAVK